MFKLWPHDGNRVALPNRDGQKWFVALDSILVEQIGETFERRLGHLIRVDYRGVGVRREIRIDGG
jgi:hypothetical protein